MRLVRVNVCVKKKELTYWYRKFNLNIISCQSQSQYTLLGSIKIWTHLEFYYLFFFLYYRLMHEKLCKWYMIQVRFCFFFQSIRLCHYYFSFLFLNNTIFFCRSHEKQISTKLVSRKLGEFFFCTLAMNLWTQYKNFQC